MIFNWELTYLDTFWLEWHIGVGQVSVNRRTGLSSKKMDGFQKNQLGALIIIGRGYKCPRTNGFGAFWETIWHFVIFVHEIFQVFLWGELRENILGNYFLTYLNFIPQRKSATSWCFVKSKNAVSNWFCHLKICELWVAVSLNFYNGGLIPYLLDLKWNFLPDIVHWCLRYLVLTFNTTLWNCVK